MEIDKKVVRKIAKDKKLCIDDELSEIIKYLDLFFNYVDSQFIELDFKDEDE